MRWLLTMLAACSLGVGCTPAPSAPEPAPRPAVVAGASIERSPSEEEFRLWAITEDAALRLGRARMEPVPKENMTYSASPAVRGDEQFWLVEGSSMLAGGWVAEIDARSGAFLRGRRLPGR